MFFFYKNNQVNAVFDSIELAREQLISAIKEGVTQCCVVECKLNQVIGDMSDPVMSYTYKSSKSNEPEPEPEEEKSEHEPEPEEEKSEPEPEEEEKKNTKKSTKKTRASTKSKSRKHDSDSE